MSPSLEGEVLDIIRAVEAALRSRSFHQSKIEFRLEDWQLARKLEDYPPAEKLDDSAIWHLSSDRRDVEYMVTLSNALLESSKKLLGHYTHRLQPIIAKLSEGIAMLPNEILALIFKFATLDREDGSKHALRLSQVSSRFRTIALRDQSLWTKLSFPTNMSKDNLKTFISRSGADTDLHVFLNADRRTKPSAVHSFLSVCSRSASRWRSLTLSGSRDEDDLSITVGDDLLHLMKQRHLVLPRLDELCLSDTHYDYSTGDEDEDHPLPFWPSSTTNFNDVRPWQLPNLRALRCTQYIPPPSFPFSCTSFKLTLELIAFDISRQILQLGSFMTSKPGISECSLDFDYFYHVPEDEIDLAGVEAVICPAVRASNVSIWGWDLSSRPIIGPALKTLRMPKLESYTLSLTLSCSDAAKDCAGFSSSIGTLFPDPAYHQHLVSLTVKVEFTMLKDPHQLEKAKTMTFDIPLDKIPRVTSLCVSTFGQVSFSRQLSSTCLRELQLRSCRDMDVEGLQHVVQSLKNVGAWDKLERVVIHDCELLDNESAVKVVGMKRLRFMDHY